jgi:hypothetical protein
MMTDPEKNELLGDVWREDDDALRESTLQRMIAEGRRKRGQRRAVRLAFAAAALIAGGIWLWPGGAGGPSPQAQAPAPEQQKLIAIHHLTEAETAERLKGYAVAYAGPPGARKIVLLEEIPR